MASLNFLRYLLIRDRPSSNRTHIWSKLDQLRSKFTKPLRQSLQLYQLECRQQLAGTGGCGHSWGAWFTHLIFTEAVEGAEVTVEVGGAPLPEVSQEEQQRVSTTPCCYIKHTSPSSLTRCCWLPSNALTWLSACWQESRN